MKDPRASRTEVAAPRNFHTRLWLFCVGIGSITLTRYVRADGGLHKTLPNIRGGKVSLPLRFDRWCL